MLSWDFQSTLQRRVQGWWCFKAGKVEVKKKSKLPKARLRNWRLRDRTFDGRCHVTSGNF